MRRHLALALAVTLLTLTQLAAAARNPSARPAPFTQPSPARVVAPPPPRSVRASSDASEATRRAASAVRPNGASAGTKAAPSSGVAAPARRDWTRAPAIVEIKAPTEVFAVSDPHGGYGRLVKLLAANGIVREDGASERVTWTGGKATLIVNGDVVDKGKHSLEVIDLLRDLQRSAAGAGGRVVVTMGNHEAEFLADPQNPKAMGVKKPGVSQELIASGVDLQAVARGLDEQGRGQWLRELPFGVKVGDWFFCHSGHTNGRSVAELSRALEHAVDTDGFGAEEIIGRSSILEAEKWYGRPNRDGIGAANATALGVRHIVFGHDPGAFGKPKRIVATRDGALVKIDTSMGDGARGHLLHIDASGERAESLNADGERRDVMKW